MNDVYLLDLIQGISGTLDYVSSEVNGHHKRVGFACTSMAKALDLTPDDTGDLLLAALLHDIGAFALDVQLDGLDFDTDLTEHSFMGHKLLCRHELLRRPAEIVQYHHTPWQELKEIDHDETVKLLANVINIIDRIDILNTIDQRAHDREHIIETVSGYTHTIYEPGLVDALKGMADSDAFWHLLNDDKTPINLTMPADLNKRLIPHDQLLDFSRFFSHIIDFRSRHTATHSQGVAETAVQLARMASMDETDQLRMRLAGNLHDIGKLSVPITLLNKPAPLEEDEFAIMKKHAEAGDTLLNSVSGLETIADWAAQHHERLDGSGYPKGLEDDQIPLGSRILAVADVCTAILEDRPYRRGMEKSEACETLQTMADDGLLDKDIIHMTISNFDRIDAVRHMVQSRALAEFQRFNES